MEKALLAWVLNLKCLRKDMTLPACSGMIHVNKDFREVQ